jgi:hypothetical protein
MNLLISGGISRICRCESWSRKQRDKRFEVLDAVNTKFIVCWDVRQRILGDNPWPEIYRRYETAVKLMRGCWLSCIGRRSTDYYLTQTVIDYIVICVACRNAVWHGLVCAGRVYHLVKYFEPFSIKLGNAAYYHTTSSPPSQKTLSKP